MEDQRRSVRGEAHQPEEGELRRVDRETTAFGQPKDGVDATLDAIGRMKMISRFSIAKNEAGQRVKEVLGRRTDEQLTAWREEPLELPHDRPVVREVLEHVAATIVSNDLAGRARPDKS